ncbi:MAG: electron transfer flavoprotein subunit beta/FixA family protein [Bifidobacteriaceae bacterium]|nr:electron transfer flavoprotein subunit beta/FixA family protein [Bifidobacteriaceae bacterium]
MRIAVLVKHVPDIEIGYEFTDGLRLDRAGDGLLSQLDEYPLDVARQLARAAGAEVVAVTVGPDQAEEALRRALQMGADRAVHVSDQAIAGSDPAATARCLAAAIREIGDVDLILTGAESADAGTGLVPVQVASLLGAPALTGASHVEVGDGAVTIRRDEEDASYTIRAPLPALVSVTEQVGEPAYPSAKAVMLARRKPVDTLDLEDIGVSPAGVGEAGSAVAVAAIERVPPRVAGVTLPADSPDAIVRFLELVRRAGVMEGGRHA